MDRLSKLPKNVQKCSKLIKISQQSKIVQNGPKWSIKVHNGPKWSKNNFNCPNCPNCTCIHKAFSLVSTIFLFKKMIFLFWFSCWVKWYKKVISVSFSQFIAYLLPQGVHEKPEGGSEHYNSCVIHSHQKIRIYLCKSAHLCSLKIFI